MITVSVMQAGCAKTDEQIDALVGVETPKDPRNMVLYGLPIHRSKAKVVQ